MNDKNIKYPEVKITYFFKKEKKYYRQIFSGKCPANFQNTNPYNFNRLDGVNITNGYGMEYHNHF